MAGQFICLRFSVHVGCVSVIFIFLRPHILSQFLAHDADQTPLFGILFIQGIDKGLSLIDSLSHSPQTVRQDFINAVTPQTKELETA